MARILSKSGDSLADAYDVDGSIAGIEQLRSEEVHLTHEMGGVLHSERMAADVLSVSSGAVAQSTAWNVNFSIGPAITRILGAQIVTNGIGGIASAVLSVSTGIPITDMPLIAWDSTGGAAVAVPVMIAGTLATLSVLMPEIPPMVPSMLIGSDQEQSVQFLSIRGATNAFGAGTVTTQALVYIAFPQVGGLSSRGLPTPSW